MTTQKNWQTVFLYILSAIVIISFLGIIVVLVFHLVPDGNSSLLNILIGVFASSFTQIVNYFFGTSKSSNDKTDMLFNSTPIKP